VGERKIRTLLRHGASIRLIARDLTDWLHTQHEEGNLAWIETSYDEASLQDAELVFAATSDSTLNRRIAADARRRRIWCNMATDPRLGSFIIPSIVERGSLTIAISTAGQSPAMAKKIREKLEEQFGPEWIFFLELMGSLRNAIQSKTLGSHENQRLFRETANLPLPEWIAMKEQKIAIEAIYEVCRPYLSLEEINLLWNETWKNFSSSSPHYATAVQPSDT
jgi:precorrin-2 dehydrogenase/sirohydrochlorin ferrochelatase